MVARLPGDRFTEEECKKMAAELGDSMPGSNICRYCGIEIKMMCFTMTGSCCEVHDKLRHNPKAFDNKPEFAANFRLPPRDIPPATETASANCQTHL